MAVNSRKDNDPTGNASSQRSAQTAGRRSTESADGQEERLAWEQEEQRSLWDEVDAVNFEDDIVALKKRRTAERKAMQDKLREKTMARLNAYEPAQPDKNPEEMSDEELEEYRKKEILERLDRDDPIRYYDKAMLEFFAEESRKSIFPSENPKALNLRDLAKDLQQQRNDDPGDLTLEMEDPVREGEDPLLTIYREVEAYSRINHTGTSLQNSSANDVMLTYLEGRLAMRVYRRLARLENSMYDEIEQFNSGKISELKNATDARMHAVSNMMSYFEQQLFGKLGTIPDQPVDEDAPHIVYTGKILRHSEVEQELQQALDQQTEVNEFELEGDRRRSPLFPHTPSPQDVCQGNIGDCFLMAVMSSLAASHPERIQEMMRDNQDGTVTVRLYQGHFGNFRPIYVTVDKVNTYGQANGPEWVQTLERALTASGLMTSYYYARQHPRKDSQGRTLDLDMKPVPANIDEIYEQHKDDPGSVSPDEYPWLFDKNGNFQRWTPDFASINGGLDIYTFGMFLGDEADINYSEMSKDSEEYKSLTLQAPQNESDIPKIPLDCEYTELEKRVYNEIDQALKKNKAVTATTYPSPNGDRVTIAGINKSHAYSIQGIKSLKIDGKERLFIKIRNPHGGVGRTYIHTTTEENGVKKDAIFGIDNSRLKNSQNPGNNGVGYVELSDFVKEFSMYSWAEPKESSVEKQKRVSEIERNVMSAYKKALKDILDSMEPTSREEKSWWDSGQYKQLKYYMMDLTEDFPKSYSALREQINTLEKRVKAYTDHAAKSMDNHDKSRERKLDGCSMLMDVIRYSRTGFKLPQTMLKERIADKIVKLIQEKDVSGRDAADPIRRMKQFVENHPDEARKCVMKSAGFQKWTQMNRSVTAMYQTIWNPRMTLEDFGITRLSAALEARPAEKLHRHPQQEVPNRPTANQPDGHQLDPKSLPPELPKKIRELRF